MVVTVKEVTMCIVIMSLMICKFQLHSRLTAIIREQNLSENQANRGTSVLRESKTLMYRNVRKRDGDVRNLTQGGDKMMWCKFKTAMNTQGLVKQEIFIYFLFIYFIFFCRILLIFFIIISPSQWRLELVKRTEQFSANVRGKYLFQDSCFFCGGLVTCPVSKKNTFIYIFFRFLFF